MQKVLTYSILTLNTTPINILRVVIKRIAKPEAHYTAVNTHLNKKLHFRIKHSQALI